MLSFSSALPKLIFINAELLTDWCLLGSLLRFSRLLRLLLLFRYWLFLFGLLFFFLFLSLLFCIFFPLNFLQQSLQFFFLLLLFRLFHFLFRSFFLNRLLINRLFRFNNYCFLLLFFCFTVWTILASEGKGVLDCVEVELFFLQLLSLKTPFHSLQMSKITSSEFFFGIEWHNISLLFLWLFLKLLSLSGWLKGLRLWDRFWLFLLFLWWFWFWVILVTWDVIPSVVGCR